MTVLGRSVASDEYDAARAGEWWGTNLVAAGAGIDIRK